MSSKLLKRGWLGNTVERDRDRGIRVLRVYNPSTYGVSRGTSAALVVSRIGAVKKNTMPRTIHEPAVTTWKPRIIYMHASASRSDRTHSKPSDQVTTEREFSLKNRRRVFLIRKQLSMGLESYEVTELDQLEKEIDAYVDATHPAPTEYLSNLLERARQLNAERQN